MSEQIEHLETFKATANGKDWATSVSISETEWKIQVDEPEEDGGTNSGPNPMQYFIASLTSCQNEQAQVVADELSLDISEIKIEAEVDLNLDGFMGIDNHSKDCFKRVDLKAYVSGNLSESQVKELGEAVDARCPILSVLRSSGSKITSSWELVS